MSRLINGQPNGKTFAKSLLSFSPTLGPSSPIGRWLARNAMPSDPKEWRNGVPVSRASLSRPEAGPLSRIIHEGPEGLLIRVKNHFAIGEVIDRDTVLVHPWQLEQEKSVVQKGKSRHDLILVPRSLPYSDEFSELAGAISPGRRPPPPEMTDLIHHELSIEIAQAMKILKNTLTDAIPPVLLAETPGYSTQIRDLLDSYIFWLRYYHPGQFRVSHCALSAILLAQTSPFPRVEVNCMITLSSNARRSDHQMSVAEKLKSVLTEYLKDDPGRLALAPITPETVFERGNSGRTNHTQFGTPELSSHQMLAVHDIFGTEPLPDLLKACSPS